MPTSSVPSAHSATSYGQVIEYIQDRLYLASYTHPPNAHTPFPYPQRAQSKSPSKRSSRAAAGPTATGLKTLAPIYFTIDKSLLYNAFHADFGPLHIGHLYRFAVTLHEVLADPQNTDRAIVFWSGADSRSRANAACMLACYMVLIQSWPPHLALAPIAQMDPPCMPFRDAGYSQADYTLSIQDIVYGVWRAKEEGLFNLKDFNLEEYETYERVDMGDFNWISPFFLAFASPQHTPVQAISQSSAEWAALPKTAPEAHTAKTVPKPFRNVLAHFKERNIGLVVRLNSHLYSASYFEAMGIKHLDMIFDDGTCPPLSLVRKFINLAHEMITKRNQGIAVHCKAGLGRTGCLIGAYLIYRHNFTANEVISYMRFMRPGMVVGPQQHWLHLNQHEFKKWWHEDTIRVRVPSQPSTPTRLKTRLVSNGQTYTPPNGSAKRAALGEIMVNEESTSARTSNENLPAPTPGQPRKTSKVYGANSSRYRGENKDTYVRPDTEIVSTSTHRHTQQSDGESEEEYQIRMLARRASRSPTNSPQRSSAAAAAALEKRRAVSCTSTTTVTTTKWTEEANDAENVQPTHAASSPGKTRSPRTSGGGGSGKGELGIGKQRMAPRRSATTTDMGARTAQSGAIRKTSGRVGSLGTAAAAVKSK